MWQHGTTFLYNNNAMGLRRAGHLEPCQGLRLGKSSASASLHLPALLHYLNCLSLGSM